MITLVYRTGPALTVLLHSVDFLSFLACFWLAFALKEHIVMVFSVLIICML